MYGLRMAEKMVETIKASGSGPVGIEAVEKAIRSVSAMTRGDAFMDAIEAVGDKFPGAALLLLQVTRRETDELYTGAELGR